ncbi:hypothetical protein JW962_00705 [Candidatus Dojkabacteria bacterium]|nr:hypothetical protein [Candidatus Dojkabacteria bacterium]
MNNHSEGPGQRVFLLSNRIFKIDSTLLGNKATKICDMMRMNLPVPKAFVITTKVWKEFEKEKSLSPKIQKEIIATLKQLEKETQKTFGSTENPLIVSVRSGSVYSMPGMMDTILDVGICDKNIETLKDSIGEQTALDSYRRLIQMFGNTVLGINPDLFEEIILKVANRKDKLKSPELSQIILEFKTLVKKHTGSEFPEDPVKQLMLAIAGVFNSWSKPGAKSFRKFSGIPDNIGTSVTIQKMVFGNRPNSGTGVLFTRNPRTGSTAPYIEYLENAQGEDVVSGMQNPVSIKIPDTDAFKKLLEFGEKLEKHYQRPQDIEFTIEENKLWILQTRTLKLSSDAAFKIASDMIDEGLITENEAVRLVKHEHINKVLSTSIADKSKNIFIAKGIPASTGAACGHLALSPKTVKRYSLQRLPSILVMDHIDPNDVETLIQTNGVITTKGGAASHMAIIMRATAKPGIVGTSDIKVGKKEIFINNIKIKEGDLLTIDGTTGEIFNASLKIKKAKSLTPTERRILKIKTDILGTSPWSAACYKTSKKYQRRSIAEKIKGYLKSPKWKSKKAQIIELQNQIMPSSEIIPSTLFKPTEINDIRNEMISVLRQGYWLAPRTCHFPEKLANSPWAMGPNKPKDIERFLTGKYEGKYEGLTEWIKDKTLEAIVLGKEPPEKSPDFANEHFVFTVSFHEASPPEVVVSINTNTLHLRSFEQTTKEQIIMLKGQIYQDSPAYLGNISLIIDQKHLKSQIKNKPEIVRMINNQMIAPSEYNRYIKNTILTIVDGVRAKVFGQWWNPPFTLPHMMSALDDALGLNVLEGQGRVKAGKIDWIKVYGTKGGEEKERVDTLKPQLSQ